MTLKDRLHHRLARLWWSLRHPVLRGRFSVRGDGMQPRHLAVILPPEFADFDVARHVIDPLLARMNPRTATVVVRENLRNWLSKDLDARVFAFDIAASNWLGLPDQRTCSKIRQLDADVVVDLTPRHIPYTAALAAATDAAVRISFDGEHRAEFFNFLIGSDSEKPLADRYDVLLRYV